MSTNTIHDLPLLQLDSTVPLESFAHLRKVII
jgi:hypothetical protein